MLGAAAAVSAVVGVDGCGAAAVVDDADATNMCTIYIENLGVIPVSDAWRRVSSTSASGLLELTSEQ